MRLTISNEITGRLYGPVEINDDMNLSDLTALLELDCQYDSFKNDIYHNMNILDVKSDSERSVEQVGLKNDDLLLIRNKFADASRNILPFSAGRPGDLNDEQYVEQFRQELIRNHPLRQQLTLQIPGLQEAIENPRMFFERLSSIILQKRYANNVDSRLPTYQPPNPFGISAEEYDKLMKNPENPENKKRLSELTDQQAIDEQLRNAYEYTPEVFTTVTMLYINLEINGTPVKAFVDTGAQMTIMSTRLAEKTGLSKLIDRRFIGEARGVGVGKIIGRIHQALIKIETQFIPGSFVVLDTQIDLLIGLDMLKRHQAGIDLRRNVLKIADVETSFLSEGEIPKEFDTATANSMDNTNIGSSSKEPNNLAKIQLPSITGINNNPLNIPQNNLGIRGNTSDLPSPRTYPESAIKQLMDLGFSRTEVIKALDSTGGNADYAASLLFQ